MSATVDSSGKYCAELDELARKLDRDHAGDAAADARALRVRLGDCIVWEPTLEQREAVAYVRSWPGQWSPGDVETLEGCHQWLSGYLELAAEDLETAREDLGEAPPRPHEAELTDTGAELERTERHERDNQRDQERQADR